MISKGENYDPWLKLRIGESAVLPAPHSAAGLSDCAGRRKGGCRHAGGRGSNGFGL